MGTSLSEPFVLDSYALPKNTLTGPSIYATHSRKGASNSTAEGGFVTVAAHGEGVHILDLSDLHPVSSHTLGPHTTFACPAATHASSSSVLTTYACIASAPDVPETAQGRTLWAWHEDLNANLSDRAAQKRRELVAPFAVEHIHILTDSDESCVALVSPAGDLALVDAALALQCTRTAPNRSPSESLIQSFLISKEDCTFVPVQDASAVLVLAIATSEGTLRFDVLAIRREGVITEIAGVPIDVKAETIAAISCSSSGIASVLAYDGTWYTYQLESSPLLAIPINEAVRLNPAAFAFISPSSSPPAPSAKTSKSKAKSKSEPSTQPDKSARSVSLQALTSSHVLLAAITPSSSYRQQKGITIHIWDLAYPVLLASHSRSLPAPASNYPLNLALSPAGPAHAVLVLAPTRPHANQDADNASELRSTVLAVPYTVPAHSTIRAAIGRASASARFLVQPVDSEDELDAKQLEVLEKLRAGEESAFFRWLGISEPSDGVTPFQNKDKSDYAPYAYNGEGGGREADNQAISEMFVRALMQGVFGGTISAKQNGGIPYPAKVIEYLPERRWVLASMVEGEGEEGLIAGLWARRDWTAIQFALRSVPDITEPSLISLLAHLVNQKQDPDAMAVDSDAPSFEALLALIVRYPVTPATLRGAIRERLPDPGGLLCMLDVLETWIAKHPEVEHGNQTVAGKGEIEGVPPLLKVLTFLHAVLDASFLTLLQHAPAHAVLQRLAHALDPHLALGDDLEALRGPLEPYARRAREKLQGGVDGSGEKVGEKLDWRQRKRAAQEATALAVGSYRLEELVI